MSDTQASPTIVARECRSVTHLPAIEDYRQDTHIIKEILHYSDGSTKPNLCVIPNFKRPFWVTKEHFRNHKTKKESEDIDKLDKFFTTESDLGKTIAPRLGKEFIGKTEKRDVARSPYLYGIDVSTTALIKKAYMDKYPNISSPAQVSALDIEAGVVDGVISIISIVMYDKMYTVIREDFLQGRKPEDAKRQLKYLYDKHFPDVENKHTATWDIDIVKTELETVLSVLKVAHKWRPDYIAIWNISYDLKQQILEVLKDNDIDPKDVMSDPTLPENLRYFKFNEGMTQRLTASGKFKPTEPEEQWHTVSCPSYFTWIDAMSAHRYIRVGGKTVPGGYSLDNILDKELGSEFKKLKFDDDVKYKGAEWHVYMVKNKPLEYVIYNLWDCMSMIMLDRKTKDLSHTLPILLGVSDLKIFDSGPKKIVDAMHFYYIDNSKVLGTRPAVVVKDTILGLDQWIITLPISRVKENGVNIINEFVDRAGNSRAHVWDIDCESSYPSDTQALNVSKDTTRREVIDIAGISKDVYRLQNINMFYGDVNAIEYCTTIHNLPTLLELEQKVKETTVAG